MKKRIILALSVLFVIVTPLYWVYRHTLFISTWPVSAHIWLDGKVLGSTPYTLFVKDTKTHTLILTAEDFDAVLYVFDSVTMPSNLSVRLWPYAAGFPNVPGDWMESRVTQDWHWIITGPHGDLLANVQNLAEKRQVPGNVISPDGKWVLSDNRLSALDESGKSITVFSEYQAQLEADPARRGRSRGFSPDSQWFWISADSRFCLYALARPADSVICNQAIHPVWSAKSDWLATVDFPDNTEVFHLENGRWISVPFQANGGRPTGWSPDGRYLWLDPYYQYLMAGRTVHIGPVDFVGPVTKVDVQTNQALVVLEGVTEMSATLYSPDGQLVAFGYEKPIEQINVHAVSAWGGIALATADGRLLGVKEDEDYIEPLYWLNDGKQMAIYFSNADKVGNSIYDAGTPYMIKIIDVSKLLVK